MAGVSDLPFRRLVMKMGAGLVFSEMIASEAMVRSTKRTLSMIKKDGMTAVQIAGCDPFVMAEAAKLNEDIGASIIDINMGCPVKKVVNGFAGSFLMKDEKLATAIIESVVKAVNIPVTLKMRTGWDETNKNAPKLAKIAEDKGIKMITIHGRTRAQMYNGKSDWNFIGKVKESVNIPVIGNGDVNSEEDAKSLLNESKADGVMIARGSFGRPWFLNQIDTFLKTGSKLNDPPIKEKHNILKEHIQDMLSFYGNDAGLKISRKHVGWYSKGLFDSTTFRTNLFSTNDVKEFFKIIDDFYLNQNVG